MNTTDTSVDETPADVENQNHRYLGNDIPWYVRLIWIGFWAFVVYYTLVYLFPAVQRELFNN